MEAMISKWMQQALTWALVWPIVQAGVVILIVLWLKSFAQGLVSWWVFRCSIYISIGTRVRIPTPTGHMDGIIMAANWRVIEIITPECRVFLPTKSFADRDWLLLREPPTSFAAEDVAGGMRAMADLGNVDNNTEEDNENV